MVLYPCKTNIIKQPLHNELIRTDQHSGHSMSKNQPIIIIISLFAVVITTHLKIKIQTNNEMVKSFKIKS